MLLIPLAVALVCFALPDSAQAVSPTPDGLYSGGNTAEGGAGVLFSLTSGTNNTAVGATTLYSDTTGSRNTATGVNALHNNQTGSRNTAVGVNSLYRNTASYNTAIGDNALFNNNGGSYNVAIGQQALNYNNASYNTATGFQALYSNTIGSLNTAIGEAALYYNISGGGNTAAGLAALLDNTTGVNNTAVGMYSLYNNQIGHDNVAVGHFAGFLTTGSGNVYIGSNMQGVAGESNACYIAGINGSPSGGTTVLIDSSGKLGVAVSSRRFKDEIKPMNKASEAILALKPVTFRYNKQIDPKNAIQFGLIAEDVEKIDPDLVARDKEGKPYSVRYEAVNAMLLNEFLKEHQTVEQLKSTVAQQEATIAQQRTSFQSKFAEQQKQIEALTNGLQKVRTQLQLNKPAPQTVLNNQ